MQSMGGFGSGPSGAPSNFFGTGAQGQKSKVIMKPAVRYAIEKFDVAIGHKTITPDVLSTLDWKNVHVVGGSVSGELEAAGTPIIYDVFYGVMRKGKMIDRDYGGNNKTLLWSESETKVVGSAMDGSAGASFMDMGGFRALAGGFYLSREYEMKDLVQLQSNLANFNALPANVRNSVAPPLAVGATLNGKRGKYNVKIYGPWIGGDMNLEIGSGVKGQGLLKLMYGWYRAKGTWPDHSFKDSSKAYGGEATAGITAQLTQKFNVSADVGIKYFKVKNGSLKIAQSNVFDAFRGGSFKSYSVSLGGNVKL
tara:strand:+ start:12536 stop:13462 length:927 start_codon:yes stop_codon:yes gene_type:complete